METVPYLAAKFVHTLLTIVAVGFNISYNLWLRQAGNDPSKLKFALAGIKVLDDRFANPCYILLLVTGGVMVVVGNLPMTQLWLWLSSVLWVGIMVVAYAFYTPALRRQIAVLEESGTENAAYRQASRRVALIGQALALTVMIILLLMIIKPA